MFGLVRKKKHAREILELLSELQRLYLENPEAVEHELRSR